MAWKENLHTFQETGRRFVNETKKDLSLSQFYDIAHELINAANGLNETLDGIDWKTYEGVERELVQCYIYRWSIDVLDVAILLRDALLKYSKTFILDSSKEEKQDHTTSLLPEVIDICKRAVGQNLQLIDEIQNGVSGSNPKWFHQIPPTSEVGRQLVELKEQNLDILKAHESVFNIVSAFGEFRDYIINFSNGRLLKLRSLKEQMNEVLNMIEGIAKDSVLTRDEISMASKVLKNKSEIVETEKISSENFEAFKYNNTLQKIPIYADGGELIYKEITFDKKVENWIENQLFPKLYDADLDINNLYDNSIITLFNTRNKLENIVMNESETSHFDTVKISKSIKDQIVTIDEYALHLDEEINAINKKVAEEIQISRIYDRNAVFLPELNFTNISKITNQEWYKRNIWQSWKEEISKAIKKRSLPFIKGIQQDAFSFVEERSIEAHNIDNNSLFLKKGYLGRSFYVQRKDKEDQIINAIQRWRNEYQGSMLVVGRNGSGKSSILDYIPQFIENFPVVQLSVKNIIKLNGRKHQASYDISESINFLAAQSINKPVIVCIDDLERWQNEEFTMYDTVKQLIDGISKFGKRIFFLISTNHFMHDYINRLFDFDSRFAGVLDMDGMSTQLMVDALVIRHNASLKNIELEEDVSLAKNASRIASKSRNNIGSGMMGWERFLEKGIKMGVPPISFSKLILKHDLLLRLVLAHGQIKESTLRKMLTNSDNYFISEELRKLRGFKIIKRTYDGFLKVNPFLIDEVEYVLLKENK